MLTRIGGRLGCGRGRRRVAHPHRQQERMRLAQQALGEITGAFSADDLLGAIFARFCIGK